MERLPHLKLLRASWRLLLVLVAVSFLVSGLNCEVALLEEQDEGILVVWVFGYIDETENESLPIEGAWVSVFPSTMEFKDPELSYHEREEAEAEFYQRGLTDKDGVVISNLSSSLHYYNTTLYYVKVEPPIHLSSGSIVNVTETKEVQFFLKQSPKGGWLHERLINSPLPTALLLPFLIATVAMSTTIAWSVKRRHTHKNPEKRNQ